MRKVLLLVVALAALALPASASASYETWTIGGSPIPEGFTVGEEYEGDFVWNFPNGYPAMGCNVKMGIQAKTQGGTQQAWVSKFEKDGSSCWRNLSYSTCVIDELSSNISAGWNIDLNPSGAPTLSSPSGYLEVKDTFVYPTCPNTFRFAKWFDGSLQFVPTVDKNGNITQIEFEGLTSQNIPIKFGPLTRVYSSPYALGIK